MISHPGEVTPIILAADLSSYQSQMAELTG